MLGSAAYLQFISQSSLIYREKTMKKNMKESSKKRVVIVGAG